MKEKYIPGEGCLCHAHSEAECGCDVDWTPREVYELRRQRDRLAEAIRKHRDELKLTSGDSVDRILWNVLDAVEGGSDE
jgi:hypothetical protein